MGKIIGIDLGTSNSLVAVVEGNDPVIIPNGMSSNLLNSVVRIGPDKLVVGSVPYRGRILQPLNTITSIKRFIGRKYNEVFDLTGRFPYHVVPGHNNLACVEVNNKKYTPQEISAAILIELKKAAEEYLGQTVTEAVITVPAYFNEHQRKATIEAGELAGLTVRRIVAEPTAAAMAYGLDKQDDYKIVVFDLGGGTFDVSVLELGDGVYEVKSIAGDGFLGGDDFDEAIAKWIVQEIKQIYKVNVSTNIEAMSRIRDEAHRVKQELSLEKTVQIQLPYLQAIGEKTIHVSLSLTRHHFEEICEELFNKLIPPCYHALEQAGLKVKDIDAVILVGGATRMKKIGQIIYDFFKKIPLRSINPDEAVALGAAIQGGVLTGSIKDVLLLDVTPYALGIENADGKMIQFIPANTTIPTKRTETFSTSFVGQTSVEINVLEGEDPLAINNRSIGKLILDGLNSTIPGETEIEVTFNTYANILEVSARNKADGRNAKLRIDVDSGFSKDHMEDGTSRTGYI